MNWERIALMLAQQLFEAEPLLPEGVTLHRVRNALRIWRECADLCEVD